MHARLKLLTTVSLSALLMSASVLAEESAGADAGQLNDLRVQVEAQRLQLEEQQRLLEEQMRQLAQQQDLLAEQQQRLEQRLGQAEARQSVGTPDPVRPARAAPAIIDGSGSTRPVALTSIIGPLRTSLDATMAEAIRETASGGGTDSGVIVAQTPDDDTVGAPPPDDPVRPEVQALANQGGVLTREGGWVLEPSLEFIHSSQNRLVFRGVSVVDAVLLGVIEATDADRDSLTAALNLRYGITDDLEAEIRVPYVYRSDRVENLATRTTGQVRLIRSTTGDGLGDIEAAVHYQINDGREDWPIFIGNLRVKSDTGVGPFEVARDSNGVELELATGSGFWSVEPGITAIYQSAPAVLFANLSYAYNVPASVDTTIGDARIGDVDPGDSISAVVGMGFGINENTSFSLGYKHNYIFESVTEINGRDVESQELHIGALTFNITQRLSDSTRVAFDLEAGVTSDAPDVRAVLRVPIEF